MPALSTAALKTATRGISVLAGTSHERHVPTRRSSGQVSLKGPFRARVMAVRTAETITTSLSFCLRTAARP